MVHVYKLLTHSMCLSLSLLLFDLIHYGVLVCISLDTAVVEAYKSSTKASADASCSMMFEASALRNTQLYV
jgi:hypothetical protein